MEEYKNMADITEDITKHFVKEDTNMEENNVNPASQLGPTPLQMVQSLMQSLGVKITDLLEYQQMTASRDEKNLLWQTSLANFNKLANLVKDVFWQKIFDLMDEEAYEWAEKNISEEWRNELEIHRPKYKIVRVTATADVVMPDDVSEYDWSDYCDTDDFSYVVETMEESMTKKQVKGSGFLYSPINDVDDLD